MLKRNFKFDFLKTIGILGIILAHTIKANNQVLLYQLRSFDVPLMVMVSGSLFWLTSGKKKISFVDYLKKRIPRLILPVWLFVFFFFTVSYFIRIIQNVEYSFSFKEIIYSLLLLSRGIEYFWIVRLFILIAIISPLILQLRNKLPKKRVYLTVLMLIYFSYEVLVKLRNTLPFIESSNQLKIIEKILNLFVDQILFLLIPYGCIFAFGLILVEISKKHLIWISLFFLAFFLILAGFYAQDLGSFVLTQEYKYPPTIYYFSYSLFLSIVLYLVADFFDEHNLDFRGKSYIEELIVFISSSSLWIYLWHIFFLYNWELLFDLLNISQKLIHPFFVVFFLSVVMVYLQKKIVSTMISKFSSCERSSQILSNLFLK